MARLSGVAVLLILVVPLFMYTCALLVGIQLGRALERSPDSINIVSVGGVVEYFAKELLDTERHRRGGRDFVGHEPIVLQPVRTVPARSPPVYGRPIEPKPESSNTRSRARSYNRNHTSPAGVISVGPWGGFGGQPFYMRGQSPPLLRSIILYHSTVIHSLACEYSLLEDGNGSVKRMASPWGLSHSFGSTAVRATIDLSVGEHVTAVEGTMGRFSNVPGVVITSLTFRTNNGRTYGPYGSESGRHFSIPAADGSCIAGFFGRSGWLLDAIGVYIKPSCYSNHMSSGINRSSSVY